MISRIWHGYTTPANADHDGSPGLDLTSLSPLPTNRLDTRRQIALITGADWQKPELQKKNDGYFSWFIQRRIHSRI